MVMVRKLGRRFYARNGERARCLGSRWTFVALLHRVRSGISSSNHCKLSCNGPDLHVPVATVLTQCLVMPDDPSLKCPSKPIGPFYSRADAEERKSLLGWEIVEDAARGYRRVVPSPDPVGIIELEVIRNLVERGVLVIACGGGGIPVVWRNGRLQGVEAVIDKDRISAWLASRLGADLFVISTDTDYVYLDYKKPTQRPLRHVGATELEAYAKAGQFPPGNMGPKIESVLRFLRSGGKEAIITSCENLGQAVAGSSGTHMFPDHDGAEIERNTGLENADLKNKELEFVMGGRECQSRLSCLSRLSSQSNLRL